MSSRWVRYGVGLFLVLVIVVVGAFTYSAMILNTVSSTPITAAPNTFDGRYLLALSDADMVGTAYADGVLMQVPGDRDTLSIVPLPLDSDTPQIREVFASNSVTSWPQVLVPSPDGDRAYIVETSGEIADDVAVYPDLLSNPPLGRSLTVVEVESGDTAVYDVVDNPVHVNLHPQAHYVLVASGEQGRQIGILPVATLDDPETYQFFPIVRGNGDPAQEITSVAWHPDGAFIAVGIDRSELAFYTVAEADDGTLSLAQHGAHLSLGNTITYGQFTSDGNHYLTAEINWNAVPGVLGYVLNPPGEMISVRFDPSPAADHAVASRVTVGQSPEGFAVSPDETLVVAVDMRRTFLPDNLSFVAGTDLNSLSLLTFDTETGDLTLVDQYGFEGVLPEHAAFDADGDALAVAIYNRRDDPMAPGYLEFWNVTEADGAPALARTDRQIDVVRGPHVLALVP